MNKTQQKITSLLQSGPLSPGDLAKRLHLSRVTIHRHLKLLLETGQVEKYGRGAHVTYGLVYPHADSRLGESFQYFHKNYSSRVYKGLSLQEQRSDQDDFEFYLDQAVVYSSKIEGNSQDLSAYLNSRFLATKHKSKEVIEIDDLKTAYQMARELRLSESTMRKLHRQLSRSFISPTRAGVYRQEPIGVFSTRGIEYLAIEPQLLEQEMSHFFQVLAKLLAKPMDHEAFYWAAWVHLTFVLIHPFSDGNGRLARLLEKWFLSEKLGDRAWTLPSEEWYFKHQKTYYRTLQLGPNYWEVDFKKSQAFFSLLPQILR